MTRFWDTCIASEGAEDFRESASRLGYGGIIWDHRTESTENISRPINPFPNEANNDINLSCSSNSSFLSKTRITFTLDDMKSAQSISLKKQELAAYDLVAVQPTTQKIFQHCCQNLNIDIITMDMSSRLPFILKFTTVGVAIARGVYFEVKFSTGLHDPSSRRYLVSNFQNLIRVTRGRNIIISSGSEKPFYMRNPHDVINLFQVFGLAQERVFSSLSGNVEMSLMHGNSRNVYKSVVKARKLIDTRIPMNEGSNMCMPDLSSQ